MRFFFGLFGVALLAAASGCGDDSSGEGGAPPNGDIMCADVQDQPSTQEVLIVITNQTASERFVVTTTFGDDCESRSYWRATEDGGEPVALDIGFQCGCECAGPNTGYHAGLQRLLPGESYSYAWDARQASACVSGYEDCGDGLSEEYQEARFAPVPAGDYEITFRVLNTLAEDCFEEGGMIECGELSPGCSSDQQITVPFTIPGSGDVEAAGDILE